MSTSARLSGRVTWRVLTALALLTGTAYGGQGSLERVGIVTFVNVSGEDRDRWIGAGIAETLASDLPVLPLHRVAALDGEVVDEIVACRVLREQGIEWLIAGSYQRVGDNLRIVAWLLDTKTGVVAQTVTADGPLGELFVLQDRLVAELSALLPTQPAPSGSTGAAPTFESMLTEQ